MRCLTTFQTSITSPCLRLMAAAGVAWMSAITPSGGSRLWAGTAGRSLPPTSVKSVCEHVETGVLAKKIQMPALLRLSHELCEYLSELGGHLLTVSKRRGQLVHHLRFATRTPLTFSLKQVVHFFAELPVPA